MAAGFILPTAALDQTKQIFGGLKHLLLDFDVSYALAHQGASDIGTSGKHLFRRLLANSPTLI